MRRRIGGGKNPFPPPRTSEDVAVLAKETEGKEKQRRVFWTAELCGATWEPAREGGVVSGLKSVRWEGDGGSGRGTKNGRSVGGLAGHGQGFHFFPSQAHLSSPFS